MKEIVDRLSGQCDALIARTGSKFPLYLAGGETPFLKAISRKGERLGVPCIFLDDICTMRRPIVVDTEVVKHDFYLFGDADIDKIQDKSKMSCCAEAIYDTICEIGAEGKHVSIVGRGHAVQNLFPALIAADATVTVSHSKTKNLYEATRFADILVVAAPVIPAQVSPIGDKIIIDVSGTFKGFVNEEQYIGNIGKLTTSYILWRAVQAG